MDSVDLLRILKNMTPWNSDNPKGCYYFLLSLSQLQEMIFADQDPFTFWNRLPPLLRKGFLAPIGAVVDQVKNFGSMLYSFLYDLENFLGKEHRTWK